MTMLSFKQTWTSRQSILLAGRIRCLSQQNDELDTLRQLTQRILEREGPLTPKAWTGAETAFDRWTCFPITQEGIDNGWKLLDRLVDEERLSVSTKKLTPGWLHRMVRAYSQGDTHNAKDVLFRIEGYAPVFEVDEKTRHLLQELMVEQQANRGVELDTNKLAAPAPTEHKRPVDESLTDQDWEDVESYLLENVDYELLDRLITDSKRQITVQWLNAIVSEWCDKGLTKPTELLLQLSRYSPLPDATTYAIVVASIQQSTMMEMPLGSMSLKEWNKAESMLYSSITKDSATREGIAMAWKVLDRLVEEDQFWIDSSSGYQPKCKSEWLDDIVEAWCRVCQKHPSLEEETTNLLIKLNGYAPHLMPKADTYARIVFELTKSSNDKSNKSQTSSKHEKHGRYDMLKSA